MILKIERACHPERTLLVKSGASGIAPVHEQGPSRMTFFLLGFVFFLLTACSPSPKTDASGNPLETTLSGEALAHQHCQSCHLFPEPALLDTATWRWGVLPNMRKRLGLSQESMFSGMSPDDMAEVAKTDAYPMQPQLAEADMRKIEAYYLRHAPAALPPQPAKPPVLTGLPGFDVTIHRVAQNRLPILTQVKIDPARRHTYFSDQLGRVRIFDQAFRLLDSLRAPTAVSEVLPQANGNYLALTMGIMSPNDLAQGGLYEFAPGQPPRRLLDSLRRPVHLSQADLNADGLPDAVVCSYGNTLGRLSWFEFPQNREPVEHLLAERPGARCTTVADFTGDGKPDVLALFAQGLEGISLFVNEGGGEFREEVLLSFSPVYGSSYVSAVDFDRDGDLDLLYTNGDNADYSYRQKPYHGVRLFLNDGKNHFKQAWFFPLHGAQQAEARDFDGDGDLDIAAIGFFPAPTKQREGFVLLMQISPLTFNAHTFAGAEEGRWLTMACADADGDGDDDVVLGSYRRPGMGSLNAPDKGFAEWVFLKNRLKK